MDKYDIVKNVFSTVGEIAKTSDFISGGLKEHEVYGLYKQGYIERVKCGYYKLSDTDEPGEENLICKLLSQGIICVESALFYYNYSDFTPREWTVAMPRSASRAVKKINENVPVKAYYIRSDLYHLGMTTGVFNEVTLPVYDRERTICDCFKYRTKLDNEIFNKAINAYVKDPQKKLANLSQYAKKMGIYRNMMNVMEVLLNG